MNILNYIMKIYYILPQDSSVGIFTKIINRIFAHFFKFILDFYIPRYFKKTLFKYSLFDNQLNRDNKYIVSLTTFPKRIDSVWIVIECLIRQKFKPDLIVLWLSKSQFKDIELPSELLNQVSRGLKIIYVEDDLKSHKKYLYAFDHFPNDYIITVDDDLYYDDEMLENLVKMKEKYPESVVTNRCHKILFNKDGELLNYNKWLHNAIQSKPSYLLVPTGGFGTLYNKNDLYNTYNDIELIRRLVPFADDLWMKVQTLLANKSIVTNDKYNKDPITVKNSQLENLVKINVKRGGNDEQLRAALNYFDIHDVNYFLEKEKSIQ